MPVAQVILTIVGVYLLIGLLVALVGVTLGLKRVDRRAKGAPVGFRLIVFPSFVGLWPMVAWKLAKGGTS